MFEELCRAKKGSDDFQHWVYSSLRWRHSVPSKKTYLERGFELPGRAIGRAIGSEGQDAKWIWADKGRVGWISLDKKHDVARLTYSAWTRGSFADIEADLRSKRGKDEERGVELRIKNPMQGEDRDVAFPTPLMCAEWIGCRLRSPTSGGSPPVTPVNSAAQFTTLFVHRGTAGFECDENLRVTSVECLGAADVADVLVDMVLVTFQDIELFTPWSTTRPRMTWDHLKAQLGPTDQPWKFTFKHVSARKAKSARKAAGKEARKRATKLAIDSQIQVACQDMQVSSNQSRQRALDAQRSRVEKMQPEPEPDACGDDAELLGNKTFRELNPSFARLEILDR
jgi:hypothetical protein